MNKPAEIHADHQELTSEVAFLKKEIEFLLKMLRNGYSTSTNPEQVKLLDAYWIGFEKNRDLLNGLLATIRKEEATLSKLYQNNLIDENKTLFKDDGLIAAYYALKREVKTLKESFYDSMLVCDGCCHKNAKSEKLKAQG